MSGEAIKIEFELPKELFLKGQSLTQTLIKAATLKRLAATSIISPFNIHCNTSLSKIPLCFWLTFA